MGFAARTGGLAAIMASLGMVLGGCASYRPAPISPADAARALDSRSLNDPRLQHFVALALGGPAGPAGLATWTLPALTLAAIYYHPDLDIAHAQLRAAEAGVVTAAQMPNPSLGFEDLHYSPGAGAWVVAPVITFVVETFGKRAARTAEARHLAAAARLDLATAGWQVRGRVRAALLDLWAARRRLALTRRRLQLEDELVGLLERRLAVGEASSLDVSRERINRAQITFAIRDLERAEADAQTRLATAIGVPRAGLDHVAIALDAFDRPPKLPADTGTPAWRLRALTGRSDVRAALQDYAAAQAALRLAVANQYPNLTLSPGYIYDAGLSGMLLLPALDLPVFNHNQGPVAEAAAKRQEAAARFTALQAKVMGTLDAAVTDARMTTRSVATGDALLADAEHRAHQVAQSFQAGEADRPALVTARIEAAATALSRFDAVVQRLQAIGALEDAMQAPLFDPGQWPVVPAQSPRLPAATPTS